MLADAGSLGIVLCFREDTRFAASTRAWAAGQHMPAFLLRFAPAWLSAWLWASPSTCSASEPSGLWLATFIWGLGLLQAAMRSRSFEESIRTYSQNFIHKDVQRPRSASEASLICGYHTELWHQALLRCPLFATDASNRMGCAGARSATRFGRASPPPNQPRLNMQCKTCLAAFPCDGYLGSRELYCFVHTEWTCRSGIPAQRAVNGRSCCIVFIVRFELSCTAPPRSACSSQDGQGAWC